MTAENWDEVVSAKVLQPPKLVDYFDDYLEAHYDALGPHWAALFLLFQEAVEKDPEESLRRYQALSAYPPCAYVESTIGEVCRTWNGDLYAAKRHFTRAVEGAPQLALFHYELGRVYYLLGLFDKALEEFDRGSEGNEEQDGDVVPQCLAYQGLLTGHYKGDRKAGKRLLKQALKLHPRDPWTRQILRQL